MSHKSSEKFWLEDPVVLITNFCKFSPLVALTDKRFSNNMNAYTRFIIILMIVIYCITKEINYIFVGLFLIILIIIMYYSFKKDSFDNFGNFNREYVKNKSDELLDYSKLPERESDYYNTEVSENNPLKNVPITDYDKKQDFSKATMSDSSMSKFVNGKIFQTADQWIFDKGTRQYYTMPNSSVPNDQTAFANWLYGTENICKEGSIYANRTGTPIQSLNCTGFDVSTPTNFGNLNDYIPSEN